MTIDNLDLDFSDLAHKSTIGKAVVPHVESQIAYTAKPKLQLTHITICIPTDQQHRYIQRDLAECTGVEFLVWAKAHYPGVTASAHTFDSLQTRLAGFDQVLAWHNAMRGRNASRTFN